MGVDEMIKEAFEKEKLYQSRQVNICFSWYNAEGTISSTSLYADKLRRDWYGECLHCPENDAVIFALKIGTTRIPDTHNQGFRFEELMKFIENTWNFKRGRPKKLICV